MRRRIRAIGTRVVLATALMIILLVGGFAVVIITSHRDDLMNHVRIHSSQLSGTVQRTLYYSMMQNDRQNIREAITNLGREKGIEIARIFNKSGEIIYSSAPADIGVKVEKTDEGCILCHASEIPVVELRQSDRSRIFEKEGTRSFGVVTPIYNEKACSSADCHVHPSNQNVLGVMYITMSLKDVDEELGKSTLQGIVFTVITIAVLSVFLMFFVRRFVHNPVAELIRGVNRVATGDLEHRIDVRSKTEIGELAVAFNRMTVDLKKAYDEIQGWGHSLEDRVEQRTRELKEAQAQLLQSEKLASLGKIGASVAHEINNPLMGILTFIRTFQDWVKSGPFPDDKTDEFRQYLDIMGNETMRISKIVRNLLAFARKSKMDRELHDVNQLLRQSVELLDHKLSLQETAVVLKLDEGIPRLKVDGGQIQQTVMNLVLNASEAMGKGGTLTVSSSLLPAGDGISIKVTDTGPGIPEEIQDKIFDPFFTTKEPGQGTGLGLPVAYGIVKNHGGAIKVRSEVGKGAEFEILLPLSMPEAAEGAGDARREET